MPTYAIIDRTRRGPAAVLMILDEREDAEAIAFELRRSHHDVAIVEIPSRPRPADEGPGGEDTPDAPEPTPHT